MFPNNMLMNRFLEIFSNSTRKAICSIFVCSITWFFGDNLLPIQTLLVLKLIDFGLGLMIAIQTDKYNKQKFREGRFKIFLIAISLGVGNLLDKLLGLTGTVSISNFFAVYLGIGEAISISGHLSKYGIHLPINFLKNYKKKLDNNNPLSTTPPKNDSI